MGRVWRAHHTALKRDDALKVLPDAFAADPERLARFRREAQVLASLNHPNIAHVYGLEDVDGIKALVMELVDGPTLADRIAQGPIRVDEALSIARQIAEALEAAHEQGIIHRDLKPANIKVRPDGTVTVLDFGLAKAMDPAAAMSPGLSQSPTITTPAMTQAGMILGTTAYMAPEQARGKSVDKRSDIWAFGCVLFEMLTGRRAFDGEEVSDTLAAVFAPNQTRMRCPPRRPRAFVVFFGDVSRRIRSAGSRTFAMRASSWTNRLRRPLAETPSAAGDHRGESGSAWSLAVVGLVAAIAVATRLWQRETPSAPTAQFAILPPDGTAFAPDADTVAVAPDGRSVVFAAGSSDAPWQLWLRSIDGLNVRPLAGTEGARLPFWSGDGKSIGFFADGKLKRVDAGGGPVRTLADLEGTFPLGAGTWNNEGIILLAQASDDRSCASPQVEAHRPPSRI